MTVSTMFGGMFASSQGVFFSSRALFRFSICMLLYKHYYSNFVQVHVTTLYPPGLSLQPSASQRYGCRNLCLSKKIKTNRSCHVLPAQCTLALNRFFRSATISCMKSSLFSLSKTMKMMSSEKGTFAIGRSAHWKGSGGGESASNLVPN